MRKLSRKLTIAIARVPPADLATRTSSEAKAGIILSPKMLLCRIRQSCMAHLALNPRSMLCGYDRKLLKAACFCSK